LGEVALGQGALLLQLTEPSLAAASLVHDRRVDARMDARWAERRPRDVLLELQPTFQVFPRVGDLSSPAAEVARRSNATSPVSPAQGPEAVGSVTRVTLSVVAGPR